MRYPERLLGRGFTLIELLVVIAIIGFLASVVLSNLAEVQAQARDVRRLQDMKNIVYALESYKNTHKHYPCSPLQNSTDWDFLDELVTGKYLTSRPVDPVNTGGYVYYYWSFSGAPGGSCGKYVILNYDRESANTPCLFGGKFVTETHCHIPYPSPLPCDDPWLELDGGGVTASCNAIGDTY